MNKYDINDPTSYILGISLIVEALLEVPNQVEKVYISSKANNNKELEKLLELCKKYHIQVIEDVEVISKLSLKENCYGIGLFKKYSKDLETNKHIVLYGFNDEGDLGTILRSAVSFDFKDIVLIDSNIDIFNPKVIRASMGSFFHLNIKKYNTINEYLNDYKNYSIYPFISKGETELSDIKFNINISLLIPQNENKISNIFSTSYYIRTTKIGNLSLASKSSIIFNYIYHLNLK